MKVRKLIRSYILDQRDDEVLYRLWKSVMEHTHCYSDKKYDVILSNGDRVIVMRCCQCWKEKTITIKGE